MIRLSRWWLLASALCAFAGCDSTSDDADGGAGGSGGMGGEIDMGDPGDMAEADTDAPDTDAPDTDAPDTDAPDTDAPDMGEPPPADVGDPCDPSDDANACNELCFPLDDTEGFCTIDCAADGICPDGFECRDTATEDGTLSLCLIDCGGLTFQGECEGTVLNYCADTGPQFIDCAEAVDEDGQPLQCALVSAEIGYDCVHQSFDGGCGDVTTDGTCEANTLVYCESLESGNVVRIDCPAETVCGIRDDGHSDCLPVDGMGCGAVDAVGGCDGLTALRCEDGELIRTECAIGEFCAYVDEETGYGCLVRGEGDDTVTGRWLYNKLPISVDGLGEPVATPIRHAQVQVRSEVDGTLLASGLTDGQGRFSLAFEGAGDARVLVLASVHTDTYALDIRDCPLADCDDGGLVYASRSGTFNGTRDLGDLTVADNQHGAFNIFNVFNDGSDFARENLGSRPPPLTVQWQQGSDTEGGTSYYSSRNDEIYVLSTPDDTDEFDDPVLGHEYGHFLENSFSRSDSPGGFHDGEPTDPRLAWGEGYGTFVGCTLVGSPVYIDSTAGGTSVTDITDTGYVADPDSPRGMNQLMSEYVIAEMLWQLANGGEDTEPQGTAPIFDVLGNYFPSDDLVDRGVEGVELVDFLDGWFCRGHDALDDIMANFTTAHGFPYDYNGPADCR